jgi:HlyD family secretion protein
MTDTVSDPPVAARRRWWPRAVIVGLLIAAGAGGAVWWRQRPAPLPAGIVFSNGRIEAKEIDISTKFAGRISEIRVDEGDLVRQGQVVARIDTRDLAAQLAAARWQTSQTRQTIVESRAELAEMGTELKYDAQELERARSLILTGDITRESLDQRQSVFSTAVAAYQNADAGIAAAMAAVRMDTDKANYIQINIDDDTLVAPTDGPIEYRLAELGEILPVGGKVYTMLDATYVYMDIFLPTDSAGRVHLGDEARICLDALPGIPLPARVTSIAAQNEFTPKTVETKSDRDKLMFRIRVRIDVTLLRAHERQVRSGLPGLTYIRVDPKTAWPAFLERRPVT